jgi:hypothetical protein
LAEHVPVQLMPEGLLLTVPEPPPALLTTSGCVLADVVENCAVTDWLVLRLTVHVGLVPVQAPLQPVNWDPLAGLAVRPMDVPCRNETDCEGQPVEQLMPVGLLVTLPCPVPVLDTVSSRLVWVKVAVTDRLACMLTTQLPVPLHAPDQPAKVESLAAAAVSVTVLLLVKVAEQALPQLMPEGLLVTKPEPVPSLATVSVLLVEALSAGR